MHTARSLLCASRSIISHRRVLAGDAAACRVLRAPRASLAVLTSGAAGQSSASKSTTTAEHPAASSTRASEAHPGPRGKCAITILSRSEIMPLRRAAAEPDSADGTLSPSSSCASSSGDRPARSASAASPLANTSCGQLSCESTNSISAWERHSGTCIGAASGGMSSSQGKTRAAMPRSSSPDAGGDSY